MSDAVMFLGTAARKKYLHKNMQIEINKMQSILNQKCSQRID